MRFINWILSFFRKKRRFKRVLTDDDYRMIRKRRQDKIDSILDKISSKGFNSLTKEEKRFLDKMSNKKTP